MSRVAIVAPESSLRDALAELADAGTVELVGALPAPEGETLEALRRLERAASPDGPAEPRLARRSPDVATLEHAGRRDLLAGEVELERRAGSAHRHGRFAVVVGWTPQAELETLEQRLAAAGAAAVELARPTLVEPPTLLPDVGAARSFRPLVETYGPLRYRDVDPTPFAAVSFVVMFGMMFADVGQGLLLALLGLLLSRARSGRFADFRHLWPFPVAAGLAAAFFGLLYGEAFGPTGLVPTVWLDPVDEPATLIAAAMAVGAVLLSLSYGIGTINRWREGGGFSALLAPSGIAGFLVFGARCLSQSSAGWSRARVSSSSEPASSSRPGGALRP
jgi:V/A-type H+-transporting ATPase subunit I